jgi:elongation factor 1-beta
MGEVAITYQVLPTGTDVDLGDLRARIKESVPEGIKLGAIEEKPIAFGLVALTVNVIVEDAAGGSEAIEKLLSEIEGVQSVEVLEMGRLL